MTVKKSNLKTRFCKKDIFFISAVLVLGTTAVWSYFNLDGQVFSSLCQRPLRWDDNFFLNAFTYLGKALIVIWLLLIWLLAARKQRQVLIALLALIIISVMVLPLKVAVRRPRPHEARKAMQTGQKQVAFDGHTSFPSGDTATICAAAAVIMYFAGWPAICALAAVCAGIALLRVTAMAHYPSDVFAGAAIGIFSGWLAVQTDKRYLPLNPPRFYLSKPLIITAIIFIPIIFGLSEGMDEFVLFLETYGVLALSLFLVFKIKHLFKSNSNQNPAAKP